MYLVRAPCKKTDRSVGMSPDKYEYIKMYFKYFKVHTRVVQKDRILRNF